MIPQDKALEQLLELGNPGGRETRAELLARALRTALVLLDADAAAVVLSSSSRGGERVVLHAGSALPASVPLPAEGSEALRCLTESPRPIVVPDLSEQTRFAQADACPGVEAGPVVFVPLTQRDPVPAYFAAYRRRGRAPFNAGDLRSAVLLGAWFSTALANLRLSAGTEKLAIRDDLTEVYNGRFLKTALRRESQRASRYAQELSVILFAVDHLKTFIDENGELRGSLLLKELALVLAQHVRTFDVLGRYAEDEFLLILPQTGREGAAGVGERARTAVEQHSFTLATPGAVTVSLGSATFPHDGAEVKDLMAVADRALEQARQTVGKRVAPPSDQAA